jgi:response regulator RpfG family c-di-GMP phosphodiesterase
VFTSLRLRMKKFGTLLSKVGGGAHFDPDVVDAFLELETTFQEVAIEFAKPTSLIRKAA